MTSDNDEAPTDELKYRINVYSCQEGGYWAAVTNMPGCATQGDTLEELMLNLADAITGIEEASRDSSQQAGS